MINIYCYFTPSHEILYKNFFLPSIPEGFSVVPLQSDVQDCTTAAFKSPGWGDTQLKKIVYWIKTIRENEGKVIIGSDVDAQFFNLTPSLVNDLLKDHDILFQWNGGKVLICAGFFIGRCNANTLSLFEQLYETLIHDIKGIDDQSYLNMMLGMAVGGSKARLESDIAAADGAIAIDHAVLKSNYPETTFIHSPSLQPNVRWGILPPSLFWLPGFFYRSVNELTVPEQIVFHHANWCIGLEKKIEQLEFVRNIIADRKLSNNIAYQFNEGERL